MACLSNLPPEILAMVAEEAAREDLLRMRLTCSVLKTACLRPFGEAFFTRRHHILTPRSLDCLLDITRSSHLGQFVRFVAIRDSQMDDSSSHISLVSQEDVHAEESDDSSSQVSLVSQEDGHAEILTPVLRFYNRLAEAQAKFRNSADAKRILTCAFTILRRYNSKITIGTFCDYNDISFDVYRSRDACIDSNSYAPAIQLDPRKSFTGATFQLVREAALTANIPLQGYTLDLWPTEWDESLDPTLTHGFTASGSDDGPIQTDLEIACVGKFVCQHDFDSESKFLQLTEMELLPGNFVSLHHHASLGPIPKLVSNTPVRHLVLNDVHCCEKELTDFLSNYTNSLHMLGICIAYKSDHSPWSQTIIWILANFVLSECRLCDLEVPRGNDPDSGKRDVLKLSGQHRRFHFEGKEAVDVGLRNLTK